MIRLVEAFRPWQRRLRVALLLLVLAFLVAWAHNGPSIDHMDASEAVAICLAVVETTLLVVGIRTQAFKPLRWAAPARLPALFYVPASPMGSLARAGPEVLQVFRD
jgi:hypothetical protein